MHHNLEVGRFHSPALLQFLFSELSISLTCFSVLKGTVSVDIKIIAVSIVEIVIFNILRKTLIIRFGARITFYLLGRNCKLLERKICIKFWISVESVIFQKKSFTSIFLIAPSFLLLLILRFFIKSISPPSSF